MMNRIKKARYSPEKNGAGAPVTFMGMKFPGGNAGAEHPESL